MNKRKLIAVLFILLAATLFVAGCVEKPKTTFTSEGDVGQAVTNISTAVSDVASTLEGIDQTLG